VLQLDLRNSTGLLIATKIDRYLVARLYLRYPRNAPAICRISSRWNWAITFKRFNHGIERIIVVHQLLKPPGVFVGRAETVILRRPNFPADYSLARLQPG